MVQTLSFKPAELPGCLCLGGSPPTSWAGAHLKNRCPDRNHTGAAADPAQR